MNFGASTTAQLNQKRRKRLDIDTVRRVRLGDGNGQADAPEKGYHWARFPMGADENGEAIFGPKFRVAANPDANYLADDGRDVLIQKELGQWKVKGSSVEDLEQAGIDTRSLNANDRYRHFRYFDELVNLNSYDLKAGLKVSVRELVYEVPGTPRTIKIWRGSDASTHVDLSDDAFIGTGSSQASIVPTVEDTHRYALLVFSHTRYVLGDPCLLVYPGVPISLFTELSEADLQTCYDDLPDDELLIAIKAYYLEYGQTKIAGPAFDVDVRQLINISSMGSVVSVTITSPLGTITITETSPGNFEIDVADGAIGLDQLADGTPNTLLGFDGSGVPVHRDLDNDGTLAANSATKLATQQAVKSYVDATAQGLSAKRSVLAATATALPTNTYNNGSSGVGATITANANGALTIDGQSVAVNDRVLIKDESTAANNGIYTVTAAGSGGTPFVLTRATDFDLASEIPGAYTFVENGTVNNAVSFIVADPGPFTIGTTAIPWTQFSRAEDIQVTAPLSKTGNTISITTPLSAAYGGLGAVASAFAGLIKMAAGVASVAVAGTDYTSPAGTENLSNKTITASSLIATAFSLLIGGWKGILTHSNSADRTYTLPNYDATLATLAGTETLSAKTLTSPKINEILDSNGNEELKFTATASAVNEFTMRNAATGNKPALSATGGDTNIGIDILPKGTGTISLDGPVVINESGANRDTRIESGSNANMFYLDASTNRIGIGTGSPQGILHVSSTTSGSIPAPIMTAAQRDAIASPAAGMIVYLSDQYDFSMYDASLGDWVNLRRPYRQEFLLHPFSRHVIVSGTAMQWVSNTGQSGGGYWRQSTPALNNHTTYAVALGPGAYLVEFMAVKNASSGNMTLAMDGADISTHDLYSAAGVFNFRDVSSTFNISTPGTHTFGVKTISKNASSTNYDMLLSWFQFVRTAEYP